MKIRIRASWLLVVAMAAVAVAGGWIARGRLLEQTRQRLVQRYQQQVASLPEREAARLIHRLAQDDGEWLEVLVAASGDDRPVVSAAAEGELRVLVELWSGLPVEENSVRAAALASHLAQQAASMPPDRRHLAHSLAQRLIVWPLDGRRVDAAKFIADCQAVLLLSRVEPAEIRVAAAPEPRSAAASLDGTAPVDVQPPIPAQQAETEQRLSAEPRPFTAPRGMRISDQ